MRREERHHLKENPLAVLLADLQRSFTDQGRTVVIGGIIVVAAFLAAGGFFAWQQWQTQQAGDLLAEAMTVMNAEVIPAPTPADDPPVPPPAETAETGDGAEDEDSSPPPPEPVPFEQPPGSYPSLNDKFEAALPKLLAAADAYPRTAQGITARYEAAAVLAILGQADQAATHYQQVIDASGDDIYGEMAWLGLAETHLTTGRYQDAIALLEARTGSLESTIPVDAVLMRLGQAYLLAGQSDDALAAFTRVVEEFPISVYYADAQRRVDTLRQGGSDTSDE